MGLKKEIEALATMYGIKIKTEQLYVNNADAVNVILPNKKIPSFQVMAALKPTNATASPTGLGLFTVQRGI